MVKPLRAIAIALFPVALAIFLPLQPAASATGEVLDLWQAVQLGQEHDESVQIARKSVEETRLQKRVSLAPLLPQLSAESTSTETKNSLFLPPVGNSDVQSIVLTQTLWNTQQHSRYAASKKNLVLAYLENSKAIETNIINVAEAYINILSATENLRLARGNVASVEAHKKVVETLFGIHESTILELAETEADLDLVKISVITAENELDASREQLIVFIGDHDYKLTPVIANFDLSRDPPDRPLDEWLEIATERNYDLQIAQVRLALADINIKQAQRDFLPSVSLRASHTENNPATGADDAYRRADLTLHIPLYQGGARWAQLKQNQIAYDRLLLNITQQTKRLRQQVTRLYKNRQSLRKRISALRSLVKSDRVRLTTTQDGFTRGDRTSQEVLDAQTLLVQSEIDLINTIHDYILSRLQLKHSASVLSLPDIRAVSKLYFSN